jgi:hypothetical protein
LPIDEEFIMTAVVDTEARLFIAGRFRVGPAE